MVQEIKKLIVTFMANVDIYHFFHYNGERCMERKEYYESCIKEPDKKISQS